ncbi:MAG: DNA-binding domain-containing protein [Myxococcales bacterium]|nr:DNA-binding domain-containing protein [Polyangiaceae bacterium]MDW8251247.1 DNA-binding domain-containing protein [Myxococcales bacterium]
MNHPSLQEIQQMLLRAFRHSTPLSGDPELTALACQLVAGNDRLRPEEQVEIYREQFFLRHLSCLEEDFPALQAVLGRNAFDATGSAYLAAYPPSSFTLRDLGEHLPQYLETAPLPEGFPCRAFLVDLARLEWALVDAFDAPDLPPLSLASLQNVPPDALDAAVVTLDPSLTLLALRYPVHEIHEAASEGQPFLIPPPRACWLGVHRRIDLALDWNELPALAFRTLDLLRQGLPLAKALNQVASTLASQDELDLLTNCIGTWFIDWVQRGWIRGIALPP